MPAPTARGDGAPAEELPPLDLLGLDLELDSRGHIRDLALSRGARCLHLGRAPRPGDAAALDAMAAGGPLLVGHNLLAHDLPRLQAALPELGLLGLPAVDTLPLSAMAFPTRPFHRLIKPYKTVLEVENDPLADARGSVDLLLDIARRWSDPARDPARLGLLRLGLLRRGLRPLSAGAPWAGGFDRLLDALGAPDLPDPALQGRLPLLLSAGRDGAPVGCLAAAGALGGDADPPWTALAFAAAWLGAAPDGDAPPAWVRHAHPAVPTLLDQLRERPCADPACAWCRAAHDPEGQLRRWFGFPAFRPTPAGPDGQGLQRAIAAAGLEGRPHFAILPTGGGKSICFQLPALARHARRGRLTVVVSPLQSLMADQVEQLRPRTTAAAALNGLLTPLERQDTLERLKMGEIGILYLSPEQTRAPRVREALRLREIGAWVLDEAHCLSQWGHDFRTDYLYVPRFIAELAREQGRPPPPVSCFSATAQLAVVDELCDLMRAHLGQDLARFDGGVTRGNLAYEVRREPEGRRLQAILDELEATLGPPETADRAPARGCAIVFCGRRAQTEAHAGALREAGWAAGAFHGGLDPTTKREVQDRFMRGELRVICATSAFGMGVDKPDVRLVVHDHLPGSLEAYLQQAGRAGRDGAPARCVLLYDPADAEAELRLAADGELRDRDLRELLKVIEKLSLQGRRELVVSHGELMRLSHARAFDPDARDAHTRVSTAVSWLERAGLFQRDENRTRVFQGRPIEPTLDASLRRLAALGLKPAAAQRWTRVLDALHRSPPTAGFDADALADLAEVVAPAPRGAPDGPGGPLHAGLELLRTLSSMASAGLLSSGVELSAWLTLGGKGASEPRQVELHRLERELWALMEEHAGGIDEGEWLDASLVGLVGGLRQRGHETDTGEVAALLRALAADSRKEDGGGGLQVKLAGRSRLRLKLGRPWTDLRALGQRRQGVAAVALRALRELAPPGSRGPTLVAFSMEALGAALRADLGLMAQLREGRELVALERALLWQHELGVLRLDKGLAVFRPAMTLRFQPPPERFVYGPDDHAPLAAHYQQRTAQVHILDAWARLGAEDRARAAAFADDHFRLPREAFLARWMPGHSAEALARRTTPASWGALMDGLDDDQRRVVTWKGSKALLVLAGPGSGKTKAIVHRCAWLVRAERVPPGSVLVLCYNRATALELRRRLTALIGDDARRVDVFTFHGLALRVVGWPQSPGATLDACVQQAAALLEGRRDGGADPGADPGGEGGAAALGGSALRDRVLAGYEHILVDEYQDIDEAQFQLVSAVAGRTRTDPDRRLHITAVGDDDQNIYSFRGASVEFLRRFEAHYGASRRALLHNHRSTRHIIDGAQALIQHDAERLKRDQPPRLPAGRRREPPGGIGARVDPVAHGRVQLLTVPDAATEIAAAVAELRRLRALHPGAAPERFALLARSWAPLGWARVALEVAGEPVSLDPPREARPNPARLRAVARFLRELGDAPQALDRPSTWRERAAALPPCPGRALLLRELDALQAETGDAKLSAAALRDELWEALGEARAGAPLQPGLQLRTLHGVKGLEFDHVVLLDPGAGATGARDDERRLLYVGMTRARETLCLLARADRPNPLLDELRAAAPDGALLQRPAPPAPAPPPRVRVEHLGLGDVYMDHAGRLPDGDPALAALEAAAPGDPLRLQPDGARVWLVDARGARLGRLSAGAAARLGPALPRVTDARLTALVERRADDVEDPAWAAGLRRARWLAPLAELRVREG